MYDVALESLRTKLEEERSHAALALVLWKMGRALEAVDCLSRVRAAARLCAARRLGGLERTGACRMPGLLDRSRRLDRVS